MGAINFHGGSFLGDESGATPIEYGLIAAGIAVAILIAVDTLSTTIDATLAKLNATLTMRQEQGDHPVGVIAPQGTQPTAKGATTAVRRAP